MFCNQMLGVCDFINQEGKTCVSPHCGKCLKLLLLLALQSLLYNLLLVFLSIIIDYHLPLAGVNEVCVNNMCIMRDFGGERMGHPDPVPEDFLVPPGALDLSITGISNHSSKYLELSQ